MVPEAAGDVVTAALADDVVSLTVAAVVSMETAAVVAGADVSPPPEVWVVATAASPGVLLPVVVAELEAELNAAAVVPTAPVVERSTSEGPAVVAASPDEALARIWLRVCCRCCIAWSRLCARFLR